MLCLNLFYAACSDWAWKHPLSPPQINLLCLWCFHAFSELCSFSHGWKCHLRGVLLKKITMFMIILLQLTGIIAHGPQTHKNRWEKMKPYHLNLHFQIWPRQSSLFLLVGFHCRPGQKSKRVEMRKFNSGFSPPVRRNFIKNHKHDSWSLLSPVLTQHNHAEHHSLMWE